MIPPNKLGRKGGKSGAGGHYQFFSREPMIPANLIAVLAPGGAVDITFYSRPLKLLVELWLASPTLYVRLNATGASPTAGDIIKVTVDMPLVVENVALTSAVALSIWNAGSGDFIWNGTGQNGCILAW